MYVNPSMFSFLKQMGCGGLGTGGRYQRDPRLTNQGREEVELVVTVVLQGSTPPQLLEGRVRVCIWAPLAPGTQHSARPQEGPEWCDVCQPPGEGGVF